MSSLAYILLGVIGAVWAVAIVAPLAAPSLSLEALQRTLDSYGAPAVVSPEDLDEVEMSQPFLRRVGDPVIRAVGKFAVRRIEAGRLRELRRMLAQAGWSMSPEMFYVRRTVTFVAGLTLGGVMMASSSPPFSIAFALGAGWCGFIAVPVMLRSRLRARGKQIARELPGVLDLLTVAMEAGLSFDGALGKVCESDPGPLGQEFSQVIEEIRLGRPRLEALAALAERNQVADLTELVHAVVQAEPLGVSMARVFRSQSEDTRRKRRQRAEEKGQKAPIKMLMPMLGCVFPTIFILLLGPAVITVIHSSAGHQ